MTQDLNFAELINDGLNNSTDSLKDFTSETAANGGELGIIIALIVVLIIFLAIIIFPVGLLLMFLRSKKRL